MNTCDRTRQSNAATYTPIIPITGAGVTVGAYDADSIMNYCNNIYDVRRPPLPRAVDLITVNYLYLPG
jgi:hypothetical protein